MRGSTGLAWIGAVLASVSGAEILAGGPLHRLDIRVALHFWPVTHSSITHVALVLQDVGRPWVACVSIGSLGVIASLIHRRIGPAIAVAAGLGIVGVSTWLLKEIFPHTAILTGKPGSFPSGHTGVAVVASGMLVCLLLPRKPWRAGIALAAATLWGGIMAWGRLVIEAHWLSDVIAGWGLGMVALVTALRLADSSLGSRGWAHSTPDDR